MPDLLHFQHILPAFPQIIPLINIKTSFALQKFPIVLNACFTKGIFFTHIFREQLVYLCAQSFNFVFEKII